MFAFKGVPLSSVSLARDGIIGRYRFVSIGTPRASGLPYRCMASAPWDGAKKLDTTISQEAILKDTGVTRKCDNIQKNSNAK